jgi:microcin C transport system ATP-binding protein
MLQLLADLQQKTGMAVLLITHDLALVRHFAHRVAVMEKGVLVEQGTLQAVFEQPQHPYTQRLLSSHPTREGLVDMPPLETTPILQARQLQVRYPKAVPGFKAWFQKHHFTALYGADFSLSPGSTLGVMGESGSGKSVTSLALMGLIPKPGKVAETSEIYFYPTEGGPDINLVTLKEDEKRQYRGGKIAMIFQEPMSSLNPVYNIGFQIIEAIQLHQQIVRKI